MLTDSFQRIWLAATALLLLGLVSTSHAAPLLNGIASHQELGKDRFIGALYSEQLTESAEVLMASDMPMRLEMKITADRGIAARRFSRMWIEGMAINVRANALAEQADNMVAFTNMFQERLLENDHIVLTLTPGQGVMVAVNDTELGSIDSDSFFGLLASTWIGRVPLSSNFRDQLLQAGDVNTSLQGRFESISPTESRRDDVAAWVAPPAPAPTPAPVAEASSSAPAAAPVIAATPTIAPPKLDLPAPVTEEEPTPAPASASAGTASNTASSTASAAQPAPASSSSAPVPVTPPPEALADEEDEDFVPVFTAESLLANQRYFSNLVRKVQLEIKYPRRALQRGYEGFIRIAITIDRDGNLLNTEVLEESEHSILNDEALEAVEDAAPFDAIPAVITGQVHEFTIPITFAMQ